MVIYYCLLGLTFVVGVISEQLSNRFDRSHKNTCSVVFFCMLLLMLCLRSTSCGIDLANYAYVYSFLEGIDLPIYEWISSNFFGMESGYLLLNKIVQLFTDEFQIFLVVVAFISVVPVCYLYTKESSNPLLAISIFLTFGLMSVYFSALRQVIAMAFVVPAYYLTKRKKLFSFAIVVVVATFFHHSAFVLAFMYPVYYLKITRKNIVGILVLFFIFFSFKEPIFIFLLQISGYNETLQSTGAYSILVLLFLFVVYSFVIVEEKNTQESDSFSSDEDNPTVFRGLRNLLILSLFIQIFASINSIAMRMNYYYLLLVPITVSNVEKQTLKNKQIAKIASLIITISFFVIYVTSIGPGDTLRIFPYSAFWK